MHALGVDLQRRKGRALADHLSDHSRRVVLTHSVRRQVTRLGRSSVQQRLALGLDAIEQHTACGTPSTPSVDDNSDLYLEDLEGEIDGELAIQQQLASWRRRRAERIQAHFRRLVAVTYFKKA